LTKHKHCDIGEGQPVREAIARRFPGQDVPQQEQDPLARGDPALAGIPGHQGIDERHDADRIGELSTQRLRAHRAAGRFDHRNLHNQGDSAAPPFFLREILRLLLIQNWQKLGAEYVLRPEGRPGAAAGAGIFLIPVGRNV
jgi:hypothetical protein